MNTVNDPSKPYFDLADAFIKAWGDLTVFPAQQYTQGNNATRGAAPHPMTQRAYLLFNRWEDNPFAHLLEQDFAKWALDRFTVPDRYFDNRQERSPTILELPEALILPGKEQAREASAVRNWLAQCLEAAAGQMHERVQPQHFCGVLISHANEQAITRHWANLGDQCAPHSDERVLFRYQDPRVMQRMWPTLKPEQRTRWLGPVAQWWSLRQPWGPIGHLEGQPLTPQWFQAKAPARPADAPTSHSPRDLFDEQQWFLGSISPQANKLWRSYADQQVPAQAQPDPISMVQMLIDADRMRLTDRNLEDYVWITWMHAPKDGSPRLIDWSEPHRAPTLNWIADQLQKRPSARFASLFIEATRI